MQVLCYVLGGYVAGNKGILNQLQRVLRMHPKSTTIHLCKENPLELQRRFGTDSNSCVKDLRPFDRLQEGDRRWHISPYAI